MKTLSSLTLAQTISLWIIIILIFGVLISINALNVHAEEASASTTANKAISVAELDWLLKPLTIEELEVEVNAWQALLKQKVMEISTLNVQLLEQKKKLNEEQARNEENIKQKDELAEKEAAEKKDLVKELAVLNEERAALINKTRAAVDAFERKGGDPAKVTTYRKYLEVTSGATVDISDKEALIAYAQDWVISSEGGLRWLANISKFLITVVAFYFLACLLSRGLKHALTRTKTMSELMRSFLIVAVRRLIIVIGLIVGLAALEVNIGPLLAVIGAAGFVIAFALQNSLANFASGILIMIFRPFDVDDVVEVAGVSGTIKSVSLLSTQMLTFDNKALVIPNNEVWGGVITNYTATGRRRVDMMFGIGYDDDMDKAKHIMEDIIVNHEKVLKDPEPVVRVHELGDSSVNFIVRPWVYTRDYWDVFWDITQQVKKRLDAEGISIPFPQRDVHVYNAALPTSPVDGNKKDNNNQSQNNANVKRTDRTAIDHSDADDSD